MSPTYIFSRFCRHTLCLSWIAAIALSASAQNTTGDTSAPIPAKFLYDASEYSYGTLEYKINATTGSLAYVTDGGQQLQPSMAATPDGHFLYGSAPLYGYSVNQKTGHLTPLKGSPYQWNGYFVMDPKGSYLLLADFSQAVLRSLKIDSTTGIPTEAAAVSLPETGFSLTTNLAGTRVYVHLSHSIAGYTLDLTTGKLSAIAGSPFPSGPASFNNPVVAAPGYLYVMNDDNTISGFRMNAKTGALTPLAGSPFPNPEQQGIAVDAIHNLVFSSVSTNNYLKSAIVVYSIDRQTGKLEKSGRYGMGKIFGPFNMRVDPSARFLYVSDLSQQSCEVDSCVGAVASFVIQPKSKDLKFVINTVSTGEPYDNNQTIEPVR